MRKNKYKRIKYSKNHYIGLLGYLSSIIGIIAIVTKVYGYEKYVVNVGIATASIGVLTAIAISYMTFESRKISDLVRYFIISNEFYQVYIDEKGKERIEYFPYVEQKFDDNNIYIRFRLDGSRIGQKLRNQEQALADCFCTIYSDVIEENGWITYVLCKSVEKQMVIRSLEDLPFAADGILQIGETYIDWQRCPHLLITGVTQSGKSTVSKILMVELIRQGVKVIYLDPKNDVDFRWFCEKYNIEYYSKLNEIEEVMNCIENEMRNRDKDLERNKATKCGFQPIYIFFDELIAFAELAGEKRYRMNVLDKIASIIVQGAGKYVYFAAIAQRCDTKYLPGALRDNLCIRIAMGHQTEVAYNMVFPDIQGVKNYRTEKGTGLIFRKDFDTRPKELIVPYIKA